MLFDLIYNSLIFSALPYGVDFNILPEARVVVIDGFHPTFRRPDSLTFAILLGIQLKDGVWLVHVVLRISFCLVMRSGTHQPAKVFIGLTLVVLLALLVIKPSIIGRRGISHGASLCLLMAFIQSISLCIP